MFQIYTVVLYQAENLLSIKKVHPFRFKGTIRLLKKVKNVLSLPTAGRQGKVTFSAP